MFGLTKDVQAFLLRLTASLERVDGVATEAQLLLREARAELAEIKKLRRAVQGAIGGANE